MDTRGLEPVSAEAPTIELLPAEPYRTRLWPAVGPAAHFAVILTLAAIVLFAYANTLHNTGFALDNKFLIVEDPRLREANGENLRLIFTQDYWWPKAVSGLYRPLTTLSYLFNYAVLGNADQAAGYHWFNFSLHWINAILVYFFVMVVMHNLWAAFFVAALFATHPLGTEAVTNIIGRADMFAVLTVLTGFLLYAKSTVMAGWKKLPALIGLSAVTTLGVFCKESAIMVAGVLVLYDFTYRLEQKHRQWLLNLLANFWGFFVKGYVALIPPIFAMVYVRTHVFARLRPPEFPWVDNPLLMPGVDFWTSRLTALKVIGKYLWLLVWPQRLSCDYSYNQIPLVTWNFTTWEDWKAVLALSAVVTAILVAIYHYRRNRAVFFFIGFFFLTFLPTANLVRLIGSIMAERFMYLPLIGLVGCLVIAVYGFCRRIIGRIELPPFGQRVWLQLTARTLLVLIAVGYGTRTFFRNLDWEDDVTLWTQAVEACPNSFKTHKSLAFALYEQDPQGTNITQIIEIAERGLAITDQTQIVLLHLGAYYRIKGDTLGQRAADGSLVVTEQSRPWYLKSIQILEKAVPLDRAFNEENRRKELARGRAAEQIPDVGNHEIYWNLGLSYMRLSQYQKALDAYVYMRHLAPTNPDAFLSVASVLLAAGKLEESAITLLQALLLDSTRQEALRLLTDIYRQIDKENCAIVYPPGQPQPKLNLDCAMVANNMCAAYYDLVRLFLENRQYDLARRTKQTALTSYPCNPEIFNQLLPEPAAATPAPETSS